MTSPPRSLERPQGTKGPSAPRAEGRFGATRIRLSRLFGAESSNYYLLLGVTLFMVVFGLVMVFSSSYVDSHAQGNGFFSRFLRQGLYALIGVPIMLLVSRIPVAFWKRWAWFALVGACALQALVVFTPLGWGNGYNTNWLRLGPVQFQPSETIKIALVVWMGMFLYKKRDRLTQWRFSLLPVLLVSGLALALVMVGGDLGTTMIMGLMILGGLFFAGTPLRHLVVTGVVACGLVVLFALARPSRLERILAFLHPHTADYMSTGWQIQQGMFALAGGGVFGVGLGNSHSKWSWLPESSTDFIFAITGEELGLIGAVLVLALFVFLAIVFCRIIAAARDPFVRVATGAVLVWILGQAFVNIAVVLGLVPVLGVPLPLISAGGTALITTLFAIGIVLSFAREQRAATTGRGPR